MREIFVPISVKCVLLNIKYFNKLFLRKMNCLIQPVRRPPITMMTLKSFLYFCYKTKRFKSRYSSYAS